MTHPSLTYASYLNIDELLSLQQPRSNGPEHDEMLFIVIHQVYELWFKQVLWELDHAADLLGADDQAAAGHTLNRVLCILKVMVAQMDVLETMTPLEFGSFRARLDSASGFQSAQFRELEALLGTAGSDVVDHFPEGSAARERLTARLVAPTLWVAFCNHLARRGYGVPARCLTREPGEPNDTRRRTPADPARGVPHRCRHGQPLRAPRRPRRGFAGVALPPRQDGRAHDRHQTGYRRVTRCRLPEHDVGQPAFPDLWAIRSRF